MLFILLLAWHALLASAFSHTFSTAYIPSSTTPIPSTTSTPRSLAHRADRAWRESSAHSTATYCMPVTVSSGLIAYSHNKQWVLITAAPTQTSLAPTSNNLASITLAYASAVTFSPLCPDGQTIIVNGKRNLERTNIVEYSLGYSVSQSDAPFYNSIIPTCIVLAAALAVVYVTLLVVLSQYHKRPKYQLLTICITAATVTVVFVKVSNFLQNQARSGYYDGNELEEFLDNDNTINMLQPVTGFFLTMAQVQVLFRIVIRRKEKNMIFWIGLALAITQAVLWALSVVFGTFKNDGNNLSESQDAVVVFAYLFKIAICIMYAACIAYFGIVKYTIAYSPEVLLLAALSHAASLSPVILFILDILAEYIDGWADFADLMALMASSVIAWEWIDRVNAIERSIQAKSVLGRQYYEEDDTDRPSKKTAKYVEVEESKNQRPQTNSPTLVATPSNSHTTAPSPLQRAEHHQYLQLILEWLKYPVQRPDTSSSKQTTYVLVRTPTPKKQNLTEEEERQQERAKKLEGLPKIYHEFRQKRPSV